MTNQAAPTLLEREARVEGIRLTTFDLLRARHALEVAISVTGLRGYAIARECAKAAGIQILDLNGSYGSRPDRIAALCQRIRCAIAEVQP